MVEKKKSLLDALVHRGFIDEAKAKELAEQARQGGESIVHNVLQKKLVPEEELLKCLEEEMEIPRVDLASYSIDQKVLGLVPVNIARKYQLIPLFKVGDVLTIAMVDPFDIYALDEVRSKSRCDVEPMVAPVEEINQAIRQYYATDGSVDQIIKDMKMDFVDEKEDGKQVEAAAVVDEAPVIKFVNVLIIKAVNERASDIHIEAGEKMVRVRYRIDGMLHETSSAPINLFPAIVTRIKVMSKMDIAESRIPQDGRLQLRFEGRQIDVRVSTYPAIYGEAVVMRLLDKSSILLSLEDLGFTEHNFKIYTEVIERPYGIVLVTGPTGSGKTTTLYATLNRINTPEKNIMTIEDPVEYELPGIRQAKVNMKAGLDFPTALRSMLRQDPDVILVGEIRDQETARIAIQAALTGHLVFSTIHTNDAAGTLTRLTNMGVEPFLSASSLAAAIAQRLVRRICPRCKEPYSPPDDLLKRLSLDPGQKYEFFKGKGCKYCLKTGYKGRASIYEILLMNKEIQDLVLNQASTLDIKTAAIKAGMKTLREDGMVKVKEGKTTVEEVLRVTQLD